MTFPVPSATNTSESTTNVTSHTVALPAGISAGDLLAIAIYTAQNVTFTLPSGWAAELVENTDANGCFYVAYKIADGSEGSSVSITSSLQTMGVHLSARWTLAHASAAPEVSTVTVVGNQTTHDPASVTPSWPQGDTQFAIIVGWRNANRAVSSYPANYTSNQVSISNSAGGNNGGLAFATRDLNATSDDPGVLTLNGSSVGKCITMAIRPAAGGGAVQRCSGYIYG